MPGYHALWDNDGEERGEVTTSARTLLSPDERPAGKPQPLPHAMRIPYVGTWGPASRQRVDRVDREPLAQPFCEAESNEHDARPATLSDALSTTVDNDFDWLDGIATPALASLAAHTHALPAFTEDDAEQAPQHEPQHEPQHPVQHDAHRVAPACPPSADDFSDLIALAGADAHDESYHDAPDALHPTIGNHPVPSERAPLPDPEDGADPLLALAAEYERALRHESHTSPHASPHASPHTLYVPAAAPDRPPGAKPPADPFDDAARTPSGESLLDLLVAGQNVDTILDSLDPFGAERIFEEEAPHEILALFATQRPPVPHASLAARLAREEHHLIGMDSQIDVLAEPSDEPRPPDPTDENDR